MTKSPILNCNNNSNSIILGTVTAAIAAAEILLPPPPSYLYWHPFPVVTGQGLGLGVLIGNLVVRHHLTRLPQIQPSHPPKWH